MVKLTVLYGPPTDPSAFENYYASAHMPLVAKIPNVARAEASRIMGTPDGSEPPYYRIFEAWFDTAETLQASIGGDEGRAAAEDLSNFATGGATLVISEVD
jgi:uncharacterized protein (TIGR02118 family)